MLRVIAGKYGGRLLKQPELKITRATTDRAKEAIFSSFQFKLSGSIFLDLFSGSGSIAIEAVSRGAMKSIAIESNEKAISIIKKNLGTLKINNVSVVRTLVESYINSSKGMKFDFIYMDPPYNSNNYNSLIQLIKDKEILTQEGYLLIETSKPWEISIPEGFVKMKTRKYGKSSIVIITNNI
ncbi:MAG: 16S rRNA (guanine(966)-N(2))-methyltransferase RsmD [Mycoplasmataceae bacterium]|nr:16S rRNA (guanine(966)-N(2))-methyltransferase RsmD [Mycoplasmataceae bacterium]